MSKKSGSYHHGDLRRALLDAAARVVEKEGVAGLSLHAIAKKAGVSSGAPYHHFQSREQLLAELAREGFQLLVAEMKQAMQEADAGTGEPAAAEAALRGLGTGYVRFALAHRGYFRVMFRPELKAELKRERDTVDDEAFDMLRKTIERCQAAGVVPSGDVRPLVLLAWSAVHGASTLWIDGPLPDQGLVASSTALGQTIAGTLSWLLRDACRKA
jgi:AcrR family transcriptional regulator